MDQPTLTTPRLVLRPFRLTDAGAVQRLAGVAEVAEMTLNIPHPYLNGLAEAWIAGHPSAWDHRIAATFAVVEPDGGLAGAVGLGLSMEHRRGELGYWIARPKWGQGLATEAAAAVVRFGFDALRLNRIEAVHLTRNPPSGRVLEKIGMSREGIYRQRYFKNGRFEDAARYGLLRREWEESDSVPPGN